MTRVGVGAKGQNNIKSVHIRFRLKAKQGFEEPEIVLIAPSNQSRSRFGRQVTNESGYNCKIGVNGSPQLDLLKVDVEGGIDTSRKIQ